MNCGHSADRAPVDPAVLDICLITAGYKDFPAIHYRQLAESFPHV
jgi:hypothetical protein